MGLYSRNGHRERVMVFIDGNNLYHSLKHVVGRTNLDFQQFAERLVSDRQLIRVYYYNAPLNREDDEDKFRMQQSFFDSLDTVPYLTKKFGRLEKRLGKTKFTGWDLYFGAYLCRKGSRYFYSNRHALTCFQRQL